MARQDFDEGAIHQMHYWQPEGGKGVKNLQAG